MSPPTTVWPPPVGDHSVSMDQRLVAARLEMDRARAALAPQIQKIGMTHTYVGEDSNGSLGLLLDAYTKAVARATMLEILSSEDFFVAMSRSAGALKEEG